MEQIQEQEREGQTRGWRAGEACAWVLVYTVYYSDLISVPGEDNYTPGHLRDSSLQEAEQMHPLVIP